MKGVYDVVFEGSRYGVSGLGLGGIPFLVISPHRPMAFQAVTKRGSILGFPIALRLLVATILNIHGR